MTIATKSLTALELLGTQFAEGQQAKVTTDNDFYGMTVIKRENALFNARTGEALPFTAALLATKFRLISNEKQVPLNQFLAAYDAGLKVKVELGDKYRCLQKQEEVISEELKGIIRHFHADIIPIMPTPNSVILMDELINGTFYIVE